MESRPHQEAEETTYKKIKMENFKVQQKKSEESDFTSTLRIQRKKWEVKLQTQMKPDHRVKKTYNLEF